MIRMKYSSIHRRKKKGVFPLEEGERVLRLARVVERAVEFFGSRERAVRWLRGPRAQLGGRSPLEPRSLKFPNYDKTAKGWRADPAKMALLENTASPDEINWGHVGTLNHYRAKLREITDSAFKEGEHAE